MKSIFALVFTLSFFITNYAQNKGTFYIYWGWNEDSYSKSDIHFKGNGYDFTLHDVEAKDKPLPFGLKPHFQLDKITIPQTNVRIGYFINDKWDISLGVEHMKYVMTQNQNVKIDGYIETDSDFDGVYNGNTIKLTEDFLTFEHTDGLNYISSEITYNENLLKLAKINSKHFQVNLLLGGGIGVLVPKTNAKLWNQERHDAFHLSGYGMNLKAGLNVVLFKYFFLQTNAKFGYIDMPSIRTTQYSSDTANQNFLFLENDIVFGFRFKL
ncbi:MAG: hypothetical protein H6604_02945 [Flavobacteriales bacterium]|nr:hypothetical protein [Flavobacteriales bacterium]